MASLGCVTIGLMTPRRPESPNHLVTDFPSRPLMSPAGVVPRNTTHVFIRRGGGVWRS